MQTLSSAGGPSDTITVDPEGAETLDAILDRVMRFGRLDKE
jgi:hypothetical protein